MLPAGGAQRLVRSLIHSLAMLARSGLRVRSGVRSWRRELGAADEVAVVGVAKVEFKRCELLESGGRRVQAEANSVVVLVIETDVLERRGLGAIYRKLGVDGREAAVHAARQLGLSNRGTPASRRRSRFGDRDGHFDESSGSGPVRMRSLRRNRLVSTSASTPLVSRGRSG